MKINARGEVMELSLTEKKQEILDIVGNSIFNVVFIKKDGSSREITCRLNVTQHCGDGKPTVDTDKYLIVYDMGSKTGHITKADKKRFYRNVNIGTIQSVKCGGKVYNYAGN